MNLSEEETSNFKRIPPTGVKLTIQKKILIGIDVSGSISSYGDKLLNAFWSEVVNAWNAKIEIDIALFNEEIVSCNKFNGKTPDEYKNIGGGNDNGSCIIRYARNKPANLYSGIVVLTDAYFQDDPITVRANCPILWLVTPNHGDLERLPGRSFIINMEY